MSSPEAVYDTLFIGQKLQRKIEDFSQFEVQFFAYLSCLLSLYDGNSVESWNYSFIKTEEGSPYSIEIQQSIEILLASGKISQAENSKEYFKINDKGIDFFNFQNQAIHNFNNRRHYLTTACSTISILPFGSIKEAVTNEPILLSARQSLTSKNLLESTSPALKVLYSQFTDLKCALQDQYQDLIVPAVVWLESLNPTNR